MGRVVDGCYLLRGACRGEPARKREMVLGGEALRAHRHRKVEVPIVACYAISVSGAGAEIAYGDGMNHPARVNL